MTHMDTNVLCVIGPLQFLIKQYVNRKCLYNLGQWFLISYVSFKRVLYLLTKKILICLYRYPHILSNNWKKHWTNSQRIT